MAVGLGLGGCTSSEAPSPEAPVAVPPTTVVVPLDPAGLEALIVDEAPAGFAVAADEVGGTGATDLEEAAADAGDPGAAAALAEARFVRGWQRLWLAGEDELVVIVYEFATPAGAQDFFARTTGPVGGGDGVFEVPGMADAVGVTGTGEGLEVTAVIATTGPYLVQVIGDGPEPGPSRGTVVALAAAQLDRLRQASAPA